MQWWANSSENLARTAATNRCHFIVIDHCTWKTEDHTIGITQSDHAIGPCYIICTWKKTHNIDSWSRNPYIGVSDSRKYPMIPEWWSVTIRSLMILLTLVECLSRAKDNRNTCESWNGVVQRCDKEYYHHTFSCVTMHYRESFDLSFSILSRSGNNAVSIEVGLY